MEQAQPLDGGASGLVAPARWSRVAQAVGAKENVLRYVRHDGKKLVLEGEVIDQESPDRKVFISRVGCGDEKTVLRLSYNKDGRLIGAHVSLENANGQVLQRASYGDRPIINRSGGLTEIYSLSDNPVITSGPGWAELFQLARRYDVSKAGTQKFSGLSISTTEPPQRLGFSVERGRGCRQPRRCQASLGPVAHQRKERRFSCVD